jgi:hypothetical protein
VCVQDDDREELRGLEKVARYLLVEMPVLLVALLLICAEHFCLLDVNFQYCGMILLNCNFPTFG